MKKILLSSVALLGFTAGAMAADLPSRVAPVPVVAAAPIFTWTGFYVGVNAGYGWNANDNIVINGVVYDLDSDGGFLGGAQAGFNYQMGSFVVGLEGDIQWVDLGDDDRYNTVLGYYDRGSDDWFSTVRARAGVAFDRALIYATGGFAFTDGNSGWTLGGGIEYAFTNNLTAKVEGLYVNLDGDNDRFGVVGYDNDLEFGLVRAGLNFKFGTY
ncbi:outer membrane protein [Microvirga roseola]|uniref:outer membrane protein n=1 Tax=Microvirga roseola TaxID=2883126 RepID=UPI001E4C7A84|nr:outer membrane protein [Microvirga roseola]